MNPYRGVLLAERGEAFAVRLAALPPDAGVDVDAVRSVFTTGLAAPAEVAASFGVILLGTGLTDDPRFAAVGRRVLARLIRS